MKTIQDKIEQANILNREVSEIQEFIDIIKKEQTIDKTREKENELNGINIFTGLMIYAKICTGSQSPEYKSELTDNNIIKSVVNAGLPILEQLIKEKEEKLKNLFNSSSANII